MRSKESCRLMIDARPPRPEIGTGSGGASELEYIANSGVYINRLYIA